MAFLTRKAAGTVKGNQIPSVIRNDAEGWWNEDGLMSATSWINNGTEGSALDFDTAVGSSATFVEGTMNGIRCWGSGSGTGGLRTSSANAFTTDATLYMVYQFQTVPSGANAVVFDSQNNVTAERNIYYYKNGDAMIGRTGNNDYSSGGVAPDSDIHLMSSVIQQSGTNTIWQTAEGDHSTFGGATADWKGLRLAVSASGSIPSDTYYGEIVLFDRVMLAQEDNTIRKYLINKWGTVGRWDD